MTTTPEKRTATLTELVAQEIDAIRGRQRMPQAQLAKKMGKTPMWVSLRLRGLQPIDMNDLLLFAGALGVEVHDLMPSRERISTALPVINDPRSGSGRLSRTDESKPGHHVAPRPFSQPRRDPSRPPSAISPSRRRPTSVRSPNRPMPH